jgi:hypothetical protein
MAMSRWVLEHPVQQVDQVLHRLKGRRQIQIQETMDRAPDATLLLHHPQGPTKDRNVSHMSERNVGAAKALEIPLRAQIYLRNKIPSDFEWELNSSGQVEK